MTHLVLEYVFDAKDFVMANGMWLFLAVSAIALFGIFLPVVTWIESRRREREAFYKAEMFRRLAESSNDSAKAALDLLREENRQEQVKKLEGIKIGGIITLGVGVGMVIFLCAMTGTGRGAPFLVGLIPAFVGFGMLVYVYFMAAPIK